MIHLNQVGYLPDEEKIAVTTENAARFHIYDTATDRLVYNGETELFRDGIPDEASGDIIRKMDFSELKAEGVYEIKIIDTAGLQLDTFGPFAINSKVYHDVTVDMIRTFYFQRCGCALEKKHAGIYTHACCHTSKAILWNNENISMDLSGGWHDAGDYGRYVTPAATALAHLLYAYEMFPEHFQYELNIPETGNGTPDLLNECRYELEWLLKMQRSDGGAYHKVSTWRHAAFVMPEDDLGQLYAYEVSSMATGALAAICAMAARIYAPFDSAFADRLKAAAILSWDFLEKHPDFIRFDNPEGSGTGSYGDWSDRDERFWAAAELYRLTGEQKYLDNVYSLWEEDFQKTALGYAATGGFGAMSFYFHPMFDVHHNSENHCNIASVSNSDLAAVSKNNTSCHVIPDKKALELRDKIRDEFLRNAHELLARQEASGYNVAMAAYEFHWGSNMSVMNRGIQLILAFMMTGEKIYRTAALNELHYLLGCNATGYSYVSGYGIKPFRFPHLRTVFADGIEECIPGYVSGGPNGHPADEPGRQMIPEGTPPMKCYLDHYGSYSLNEITIYWNSPAVFVSAYFDRE